MLGLILILAGCAEPPVEEETAAPEDTATALVTAELPDPAWDSEGVQSQLTTALALGLPDATAMLMAFQAMFAGSDADCPETNGDYNMREVVTSCTTDGGWVFAGVTTFEPDEGNDFWLLGDGYIIDGDGLTFILAGEIERTSEEADWEIRMTGNWGYPGSEISWLAGSSGMALWASSDEEGLHLNGGEGVDGVDLYFKDVLMAEGCVTGELLLRDPLGSWYSMVLADTCDGCGSVTYGDLELGEVCVDLAATIADLATRME